MKAAALALCAALVPGALQAQRFQVAGEAFNAQHRVLYQSTVSERSGFLIGGAARARLGPIALRVGTLMGTLGDSDDPANPKTSVRTSSIRVAFQPKPWLEAGVEAEARRFDSDGGVAIWKMYGATARLAPPMGMPGLSGLVEVSLFPSASVSSGESLSPAMRGTVGVGFASPSGALGVSLAYRFERFDFGGTAARLEQFRGVMVGVSLSRGR